MEGRHVQVGDEVDDSHCPGHQLSGRGGEGGEGGEEKKGRGDREEEKAEGERGRKKEGGREMSNSQTSTMCDTYKEGDLMCKTLWAQLLVRNDHVIFKNDVTSLPSVCVCTCACACVCACVYVCAHMCLTVMFEGSNAFHSST